MSLLLDALKKAADDKQKASQTGRAAVEQPVTESVSYESNQTIDADDESSISEELSLDAIDNTDDKSENLLRTDASLDEELTLESIGSGDDRSKTENQHSDDFVLTQTTSVNAERPVSEQPYQLDQDQHNKAKDIRSNNFTVSDDALSMLIYKTNRDVKRGRKILYSSIFIASIAVIVFSGIYYYHDTQAEIAALERKHQIEMLSMQSKMSVEKTKDKSAIIRNLVGDSDLDEKVQFAKKVAKAKPPAKKLAESNKLTETKIKADNIDVTTGAMSFRKTNKIDSVGEKLDDAWLAYEKGQYNEAESLYKDVLNVERKNRDALLGLGAIAVVEKNNSKAREIYLTLLKLDPRDPIATAAVASLQSDESSLKSDEEYMLSMQQKNPDAPHLNFALGNIYAQQNQWKAAQQYYFNAWQKDIDNADYIYNLAVSMDQLGKSQQAINFYKNSLDKAANKQVSFSREAVTKRVNELSGM
jgi:tetratricopeptide (TPR) repeat protein